MPGTTRGGLVPARIYEVDSSGSPSGALAVSFMFNPKEYVVSLSNNFKETETGNAGTKVELTSAGHQTLALKQLVFDTYDTGIDVSVQTRIIWELMKPLPAGESEGDKPTARFVAFEWGTFRFVSVITQATQTFTLFTQAGVPVRANVDITFTQFEGENPAQNPSSGGGPVQRIWRVRAGDRMDIIAYAVYRDATKWRLIADYNNLDDPFFLRPGTELSIPPRN